MKAKRQQKLPLYKQICELLHREITAGHWLPGERLPVESELASNLNVAVGTLRKSLAQLESQGMLERRQGSGTYVKRAPKGKAVYQFFHLELPQGGGVPSAEILAIDLLSDSYVAEQLKMTDLTSQFWRIKRRRFLNGEQVAIEEIWLKQHHSKQLKKADIHESLYVHYREHFNFWINRVEDSVFFDTTPDWVKELLASDQSQQSDASAQQQVIDQPYPLVERRGWSNNNELEEFSRTWFDSKKCRYIARWS